MAVRLRARLFATVALWRHFPCWSRVICLEERCTAFVFASPHRVLWEFITLGWYIYDFYFYGVSFYTRWDTCLEVDGPLCIICLLSYCMRGCLQTLRSVPVVWKKDLHGWFFFFSPLRSLNCVHLALEKSFFEEEVFSHLKPCKEYCWTVGFEVGDDVGYTSKVNW